MKHIISAFRFAFLPGFFLLVAALFPSALLANQAPPAGTILPIRLNSTISSARSHGGQQITGSVMQDVPLDSGGRIRKGSKVIGHIVEAVPATAGQPARLSLQFDKIVVSGQTASIVSNLRAIAGFMQINEAQLPNSAPGETDVYNWMTTTQWAATACTERTALSEPQRTRTKLSAKPSPTVFLPKSAPNPEQNAKER